MFKSIRLTVVTAVILTIAIVVGYYFNSQSTSKQLPIIAIANYGPHSSLDETIAGLKAEIARRGLKEGIDFEYRIADVNFELTLIPQMITKLMASNPKVIVALSTPVAQVAKNQVKDIPVVFSSVTSPVEAGLIEEKDKPYKNVTGSSDQQDLAVMLRYVQKLLPKAKTIGMLYSSSEANDAALVAMMKQAAEEMNMTVVAIPVEQARDIPFRMQGFNGKVDAIYVGASGAVQPALPAIVQEAEKMKIPVFNMNKEEVKADHVFASFGVSYFEVGVNTGELVYQLLQGTPVAALAPKYPSLGAYEGVVSQKRAEAIGVRLE